MKSSETEFVIKLHDNGVSLAESDVVDFERDIGARLPRDYRDFLLLCNGGRFYESVCFPVSAPLSKKIWCDEFLLRIVYSLLEPSGDDVNDLRQVLRVHQGRIPPHTLPIADDSTNMLLLDLDSGAPGSIWIWIRDNEPLMPMFENRHLLTRSFNDLMYGSRVVWDTPFDLESVEPFQVVERFDNNRLRDMLESGLEPDSVNEVGVPLLVLACERLNFDAVSLLLSHGANPDLPDPRYNQSPLYVAAASSAFDIAKLLLDHGASRQMPVDPSISVLNAIRPRPRGRMAQILEPRGGF
jgi:hypothetical protein